ncbi:small proline-rich protein 2B-like [Odontomachus brunneus]|uniref:small proline-rich protein 2B-like n=1 Tax=Odontomachus brunneus TaxID=486640 RepID=UPI0013F1B089|nr:small proline-rich protein 2B-like [Odontomachus brunneus]
MLCNKSKRPPGWNDMEELKYLICCIDKYKCPKAQTPQSCSIMLPPRIEEFPCKPPPRRPPCIPPPRCCPITPGPCCPDPLPPPNQLATPLAKFSRLPEQYPKPCCYRSPLPYNPYN